jgi:hypothetical protein
MTNPRTKEKERRQVASGLVGGREAGGRWSVVGSRVVQEKRDRSWDGMADRSGVGRKVNGVVVGLGWG